MSSAAVRKTDSLPGTAIYIAADCECGGDPIIHLIRGRKLVKFTIGRADIFALQNGDIIGLYCADCGQLIELGWIAPRSESQ
jgi:hypothetical protein